MLATKGVTVLAISFDAKPPAVLVEGPDGWHEVCAIKKWFKNGDPPEEVFSHLLADIASFECMGLDEHGNPAMARYDVKLQGIGEPLERHADGTFGQPSGRRLADRLERAPAVLPAVFDQEGMS